MFFTETNSNIGDLKHYTGTITITSDSAGRFNIPIPEHAFGVIFNILNSNDELDCTTPMRNTIWDANLCFAILVSQYAREVKPNTKANVIFSYWA